MIKRNNKKGFTIVELVIVIAVIAILAAVLIPTFSGLIKKANESKDIQLIRNLNTAVAAELNESITMAEAIEAAAEFGFDVEKIEAKVVGNKILWDSVAKVFCYLNDGEVEYASDVDSKGTGAQLWIIDRDGDAETDATYSSYVVNLAADATVNAKNNIDVTGCSNNVTVSYTEAGKIDIYTKAGDSVTINNAEAEVNHYGEANLVDITEVKGASYHLFGKVVTLKVLKGNVEPEAGSKIQVLVVSGNDAVVTIKESVKENVAIVAVIIDTSKVTDTNIAKIEKALEEVVPTEDIQEIDDTDAIDGIIEKLTTFAGGSGTKEDPYLIETAAHLQNIGSQYELGYKYYKVADGVSVIDCSGWPKELKLNGSFDGNGVTLTNLSNHLFKAVGRVGESDNIVIKNFTANMENSDGCAFVRNVYNGGKTTFENITLYGTVEGAYNMGSFYNYGTANGSDEGANYSVEFKNAKSYLTLICTSGNGIGGMLGHGYEGAGNTLTITMDDNSGYFGKMYTTNGNACSDLMAMCSNGTNFVLNGTSCNYYDTNYKAEHDYPSTKLVAANPSATADGYTVAKQEGAAYYTVSVNAQVSSYDEAGNLITNSAGITMVLDKQKVEDLDANVFSKVSSVEIVNETLDGKLGYALDGEVLKAYVGDRNALSGTVTLYVTQYDAEGDILATGKILLGEVTKD